MTETVMVVLHGKKSVLMPAVGRWSSFVFMPGVTALSVDHWDALLASLSSESAPFWAARTAGLIGPVDETPAPVPPKPKPEPKPELLEALEREDPPEPFEASVVMELSDEEPTEQETPAAKAKGKASKGKAKK